MLRSSLIGAAITIASAQVALANVPEQCVAEPSKTQPCDNLIYKRANTAVPNLNISAGEMVCICKADFMFLTEAPATKVEEITRRAKLRSMAAHYGMAPESLIDLLVN